MLKERNQSAQGSEKELLFKGSLRLRLIRYVLVFVMSIAATHGVTAAISSVYLIALEEHRLLNLRNFEPVNWTGLVSAFSARHPHVETLFIGSSFTWGYSWHEDVIFTRFFPNSINISTIGGGPETVVRNLSAARRTKADRVIIEVNPSNLVGALGVFEGGATTQLYRSYTSFFLENPFGVQIFEAGYNQYNYAQAEREYYEADLPESYFLKVNPENRNSVLERISAIADAAEPISDDIYFFFSPQIFDGSPDFLRQTYDALQQICLKEKRLKCIDTSGFQDKAHFVDVSHLNIRGHEAFAEFLKQQVGF